MLQIKVFVWKFHDWYFASFRSYMYTIYQKYDMKLMKSDKLIEFILIYMLPLVQSIIFGVGGENIAVCRKPK